jgi:hypothetical protein
MKKNITFKEYYKEYLKKHTNVTNRRLHVIGQILTIIYFLGITFLTFKVNFLFALLYPLTLFIVYPFAWSGHFFFEKNKPAAFKNPWKAKAADWVMLKDIIIGKIKL